MRPVRKAAESELMGSLDFLIRDTRLLLTGYIEGQMARLGIPLRIWFPLRVLYENEGLTQRELGRKLGFGDARAGVIVGVLLRRKLVSRRQSPVDKRRIDLFLTPSGRRVAEQVLNQSAAINAQIVNGFSEEEAKTFTALLIRAHENLKISN